jgi:hypothetical protein
MLLFAFSAAFGQVEWKDRYVTLAALDQRNPAVAIPYNNNYTIIVWESKNGEDETDVYAQKIDNVHGLAQWRPVDGVPVCTYSGNQSNPRAAYDSLGGVIITWEDYRNGAAAAIYAQRLDISTGNVSNNWTVDGVPICETGYHSERPRIVGTDNGAFIVWIDWRNSSQNPPYDRDVFVQYIKSDAQIAPGSWRNNGLPVPLDSTNIDQINPELAIDHHLQMDANREWKQGVAIVYQDNRNPSTSTSDPVWNVFADAFDVTGNRQYGDVEIGVDPNSIEEQTMPRIVTTKQVTPGSYSHAFVVWRDARDAGSTGYDIYGQRLDETGSKLAGSVGMVLCQDQYNQGYPVETLWERPEIPTVQSYMPYVTVAWEDMRTGNSSVYAAMIELGPGPSFSSTIITPNTLQGELISAETDIDLTQIAMDNVAESDSGHSRVYIGWRRPVTSVQESDIHYQSVYIPDWLFDKQTNGWPVTQAKGEQNLPQVSGNVFAYEDARRNPLVLNGTTVDSQDDFNIYSQTPGECTGPTEMDWRDMHVQWMNSADRKRFVTDPADYAMYVVWDETRDGCQSVFIQKFDKYGVPRWINNGVRVSDSGVTALNSDVTYDGTGGAMVVWQQLNGAVHEIYPASVSADGSVTVGSRFYEVANSNDDDTDPHIIRTITAAGSDDYQCLFLRTNGNGVGYRMHGLLSRSPVTVVNNGGIISFSDLLRGAYYNPHSSYAA